MYWNIFPKRWDFNCNPFTGYFPVGYALWPNQYTFKASLLMLIWQKNGKCLQNCFCYFHTNFTVIVFGNCAIAHLHCECNCLKSETCLHVFIKVKSIGKQTYWTGRSGNIVHILYFPQFLKGKQNKKKYTWSFC